MEDVLIVLYFLRPRGLFAVCRHSFQLTWTQCHMTGQQRYDLSGDSGHWGRLSSSSFVFFRRYRDPDTSWSVATLSFKIHSLLSEGCESVRWNLPVSQSHDADWWCKVSLFSAWRMQWGCLCVVYSHILCVTCQDTAFLGQIKETNDKLLTLGTISRPAAGFHVVLARMLDVKKHDSGQTLAVLCPFLKKEGSKLSAPWALRRPQSVFVWVGKLHVNSTPKTVSLICERLPRTSL